MENAKQLGLVWCPKIKNIWARFFFVVIGLTSMTTLDAEAAAFSVGQMDKLSSSDAYQYTFEDVLNCQMAAQDRVDAVGYTFTGVTMIEASESLDIDMRGATSLMAPECQEIGIAIEYLKYTKETLLIMEE